MSSIKDIFEWEVAIANNDTKYSPPKDTIIEGGKYVVVNLVEVANCKIGTIVTLLDGRYYDDRMLEFYTTPECSHNHMEIFYWCELRPYVMHSCPQ